MNKINKKSDKNFVVLFKKIFQLLFKTKTSGFLTIIGLIILFGIANASYKKITTRIEDTFSVYTAKLADLKNTITETGTVKIADETKLSFKYGGIINNINVKIGDRVARGTLLAQVNTGELNAQYQEADASIKSAQAQLNQLLAGATKEEINLAKAKVKNAQITLQNKQESLINIKLDADSDLKSAYQDAVEDINNIDLDIYNIYIDADLIKRTYFGNFDQESLAVKEALSQLKEIKNDSKNLIQNIINDTDYLGIDSSLVEMKKIIDNAYDQLTIIRDMMRKNNYVSVVSVADKATMDSAKATMNTARTTIISAEQTISSTKITNATNISSAKALIRTAEQSLEEIKISLNKLLTPPTPENINIYEARVAQAKAQRSMFANKIARSIIKAPSNGQVVNILKRVGETSLSAQTVISFLPEKPFQIKADIYEEDIALIKIGDPVEISLIAFPDQAITGRVSSIDPIEKIIDNVVYYEVTIDFDNALSSLKSGMTADIGIITKSKNKIIVIPKSALIKKGNKYFVKVLKNEKIKEYPITVGMKGDDGMVEIISGIKKDDKIILP